MNIDVEIKRHLTITEEDLLDLMASAVYSINYWVEDVKLPDAELRSRTTNIEEYVSKGGRLVIFVDDPFEVDAEGNDVVAYMLTTEKILTGIKTWIEAGMDRYHAFNVSDGTIDWGDVDGEMADMIIQIALFGDIIYG